MRRTAAASSSFSTDGSPATRACRTRQPALEGIPLMRMTHSLPILITTALLLGISTGAPAQTADVRPSGHIPNLVGPYWPHHVAQPRVTNSPRVSDMVVEGKIMLSLEDAITLALENNLDLAIARYNLAIADTDVLRAKSGNAVRGVATGLVQGTPGGGVGGFGAGAPGAGPGGTSGGAGGAGTGASGLVQSTLGAGAPVESYDPSLTGIMNIEHSSVPLSNTVTTGVPLF